MEHQMLERRIIFIGNSKDILGDLVELVCSLTDLKMLTKILERRDNDMEMREKNGKADSDRVLAD